MSTKYNKMIVIINGKTEVLYLTDSELERSRGRLGKEGCEDTSVGTMSTVEDIYKLPRTEGTLKKKVLLIS